MLLYNNLNLPVSRRNLWPAGWMYRQKLDGTSMVSSAGSLYCNAIWCTCCSLAVSSPSPTDPFILLLLILSSSCVRSTHTFLSTVTVTLQEGSEARTASSLSLARVRPSPITNGTNKHSSATGSSSSSTSSSHSKTQRSASTYHRQRRHSDFCESLLWCFHSEGATDTSEGWNSTENECSFHQKCRSLFIVSAIQTAVFLIIFDSVSFNDLKWSETFWSTILCLTYKEISQY